MSDFKEWRDAVLFAFICFPHAEDVAIRATRCVAHDDYPSFQHSVADNTCFAVVFSRIFDLQSDTRKDQCSVRKIQPALRQRFVALGWVKSNPHAVIVATSTTRCKALFESIFLVTPNQVAIVEYSVF